MQNVNANKLKKLKRADLLEMVIEQNRDAENQDSSIDIKAWEEELRRERHRSSCGMIFKSTTYILLLAAVVVILAGVFAFPVLQIYGTSMAPNITDGDFVVTEKTADIEQGDVISFYYNNKVLVKRVIAVSGQWVNMDVNGNVSVDGIGLDEQYLAQKAYGQCDIDFPYQVPEGKYFVMGDDRNASVDSRVSTVGCVSGEQLLGKVIFRIWPLTRVGLIGS